MRALTPAYASPEQIRGDTVSTATDVYSLGIVLSETLSAGNVAGKPPDRDLGNIVMMATRPEPERRYGSVDQLSDDVKRYLAGLPVVAREDTLGYRAGKFLRRNSIAVAAAAAFAALLSGGVFSVAWQAHQTEIQRARAEQRLGQLLELANRTLFNVHGAIERLLAPLARGARSSAQRSSISTSSTPRAVTIPASSPRSCLLTCTSRR